MFNSLRLFFIVVAGINFNQAYAGESNNPPQLEDAKTLTEKVEHEKESASKAEYEKWNNLGKSQQEKVWHDVLNRRNKHLTKSDDKQKGDKEDNKQDKAQTSKDAPK